MRDALCRALPLLALAACALPSPGVRLAAGPEARTTRDGLVEIANPDADVAFLRPGVDFRPYGSLLLEPLGITPKDEDETRTGWGPTARFELDDEARARMQQLFRDAVVETLGTDLGRGRSRKRGYAIVHQAGPDVLRVAASLVAIRMTAPVASTRDEVGSERIYSQSSGSMVLVMELRDSVSGEALLRLADRKSTSYDWYRNNSFSNWSDVRATFRHWAKQLRRRLDLLRAQGALERPAASP